MRIAYQGEPGAYSEAAALRFNPSADPLPLPSFDDVFHAVAQGEATHGILPIENTIGGSIHRNYDLLLEHELPIVAEVKQPIVHNLIVRGGTRLEDVRKVYSHPQGLAQCERFLRTLDRVEMVPTYDTAGSAKMIREQDLAGCAAIASERAAEVFGLEILRSGVQDFADNFTRFLIVSRDPAPLGTPDKTTIVFTVSKRPRGALQGAERLRAARHRPGQARVAGRSRTGRSSISSTPTLPRTRNDLRCARALMHLAEFAPSLRTLGSYQAWKEPEG